MKRRLSFVQATCFAGTALAFGACGHIKVTHVPPGESLNVALARRADLVRLPAPPPSAAVRQAPNSRENTGLPQSDNSARVAEAFSRGDFCMSGGKDDEAIAAFQEAVKLDPTFTDAWQRLAALYEKKGDNKKAIDAFRRSKIASQ
jgi:tetratricopeptide (TPR) repeat protein